MNRQRVGARAQTGQIDRRHDFVRVHAANSLAAAAQDDVDRVGRRPCNEIVAEILEMHGPFPKRSLHRPWNDSDSDLRHARRLEPERRIQKADCHAVLHRGTRARHRNRLGRCLADAGNGALWTDDFHRDGIDIRAADDEAGRRFAFQFGNDRHLPGRGNLEREHDCRRRDLDDLHAEGHTHLLGRDLIETPADARSLEIELRDDVARSEPRERARAAAHAHVDERRSLTHHLDAGGKLLEFERNAKTPLDRLVAGHEQPQQDRNADRQRLEPEVTEGPGCLHAGCTSRCRRLLFSTSERSRERSASVERPRSICPSTTSEMLPVCSDTTIAMESFSSVSPMAARCLDPSSLLSFGLTVSGRKQAAAATRSSWMMTAPSCRGT